MEEFTTNFTTATNCQSFQITAKLLQEYLAKARKEGRNYAWAPLDDDYSLPEKTDFNYEIACPNFLVGETQSINGLMLEVEVCAIFENYQGYENVLFSFAKVFQEEGEPNLNELVDIARMFAYLRFSIRDDYRDRDSKWWSDFLSTNIVSNETVMIFKEDKDAARSWAERTLPKNSLNAWIGKCGEFVFATWAGECGLPLSRVDLKPHPEGDECDFSQNTLLLNRSGKPSLKLDINERPSSVRMSLLRNSSEKPSLKLDIKTFQLEADKEQDWWNVDINCLQGKHQQDLIIFVVIDEYFRMGKVVGYLSPNAIVEKGEYIDNGYSGAYYRVYLNHILNPYYLRSTLDSPKQFSEGLFSGIAPHKVITNIIKDYPLDPITAYYAGYYCDTPQRGGVTNLTTKPTLTMFVSPNV